MHAAKLENSDRLQGLLRALRENPRGLTGAELWHRCAILNPGTYCSELRQQGYPIRCEYVARSENGRRVYRYRLEG